MYSEPGLSKPLWKHIVKMKDGTIQPTQIKPLGTTNMHHATLAIHIRFEVLAASDSDI